MSAKPPASPHRLIIEPEVYRPRYKSFCRSPRVTVAWQGPAKSLAAVAAKMYREISHSLKGETMATLLFFGPKVNGDRDTYLVNEEIDEVTVALNGEARFVAFTDPGDGSQVWFRAGAVRYYYAD